MATSFADFTRVVRSHYVPVAADGILESTVAFKEIQKANGPPKSYGGTIGADAGIVTNVGGSNYVWNLVSGRIQSGTFGASSPINPSTPDILTQATLNMGGYWIGYAVTDFETMSLGTEEEFAPLLKIYETQSEREWYTLFEQGIFSNTTGQWQGAPAFMATTGTYATNIDLSTTWGGPSIFNFNGSTQNFAVSGLDRFTEYSNRATHGDTQDGNDRPNVAFTTRTDWTTMKVAIENTRHLIDVDQEMVNIGFVHFSYDGIRVYWSDYLETQAIRRVYIWNTHFLGVAHAGKQLFRDRTAVAIEGIPRLVALGLHKGTLFCSSPRKQAALINVNQS